MTQTGQAPRRRVAAIEVLEDRAEQRGPREGFLHLARLLVRTRYDDGGRSAPFACDIVSRTRVDAVTIVLYQRRGEHIDVGLRENLRVPIYLRRHKVEIPFRDEPPCETLLETVAGLIEPEDAQGADRATALRRRSAAECLEEVGLCIPPERIRDLGAASFPSPGTADEKVYFQAAEVDFALATSPAGDGSVMEEYGGLVVLPLEEALTRCRDGRIPDMKTEIALARLRELIALEESRP